MYFRPKVLMYLRAWLTYHYPVSTELHVNPVILVIPDTFDTMEVSGCERVCLSSEWLNVKALRDLSLTLQNQHPCMYSETM